MLLNKIGEVFYFEGKKYVVGEKVVANERAKQADAEAKIAALKEQIAALK